jgi:hypothetical protein
MIPPTMILPEILLFSVRSVLHMSGIVFFRKNSGRPAKKDEERGRIMGGRIIRQESIWV